MMKYLVIMRMILTSYQVPEILLHKLCLLLSLASNSQWVGSSQAGYLCEGGQLGAELVMAIAMLARLEGCN